MKIAVIGAGSWGTAIAGMLAQKEYDVFLWARSNQLTMEMKKHKINRSYLPDYLLPSEINFTSDLNEAVTDAKIIVLATPSHAIRETSQRIAEIISSEAVIVSASKGQELHIRSLEPVQEL